MSDAPTTTAPPPPQPALDKPPHVPSTRMDDVAYVAPMAAYLAFIQVGSSFPNWFVESYYARAIAAGALILWFWRRYTPVRWTHVPLGLLVGAIGIVQWIGMQVWLGDHIAWFKPDPEAFDPFAHFASPAGLYGFIAIRMIGAAVVVPFMEELFWRDWLWRTLLAPNDFKLAKVGEFSWTAVLGTAVAFSTVHGVWWPTAIVWGLLIAGLLVYTKSLGACIAAHFSSNLLLGIYVLYTKTWHLW